MSFQWFCKGNGLIKLQPDRPVDLRFLHDRATKPTTWSPPGTITCHVTKKYDVNPHGTSSLTALISRWITLLNCRWTIWRRFKINNTFQIYSWKNRITQNRISRNYKRLIIISLFVADNLCPPSQSPLYSENNKKLLLWLSSSHAIVTFNILISKRTSPHLCIHHKCLGEIPGKSSEVLKT